MLKMKDVYVNNPALGDPNALEKKIEENAQKIDSLQAEMRKYQVSNYFIYYLKGRGGGVFWNRVLNLSVWISF